jgi:hypothetical protein
MKLQIKSTKIKIFINNPQPKNKQVKVKVEAIHNTMVNLAIF